MDIDGVPLDVDGVPLKAPDFDGVPIKSMDVDGVPLKAADIDGVPLSGSSNIDGVPSEYRPRSSLDFIAVKCMIIWLMVEVLGM